MWQPRTEGQRKNNQPGRPLAAHPSYTRSPSLSRLPVVAIGVVPSEVATTRPATAGAAAAQDGRARS
jgi:hypothetical protein